MTAINVLLETDRVHFFSDGGHFAGHNQVLCQFGNKVMPLPLYNAAMTYSGPSAGAPALLAEIEGSAAPTLADLLSRLPVLVAAANRKAAVGRQAFSAIVAGVEGGMACGVAIEEGGAQHLLAPGSFVRSLASDVPFDPSDPEASGLAMMEDQRRQGVVAGWCQHSVVRHNSFQSRILRRWSDTLAAARPTVQAKIGTLQVNTINFADSSVTGAVQGSDSVSVPNAGGYPVILSASLLYTYKGSGTTSGLKVTGTIVRSDSKVIVQRAVERTGPGTSGPHGFSFGGLDSDAPTSATYTFVASLAGYGDPPIGSGTISNKLITGLYTKK